MWTCYFIPSLSVIVVYIIIIFLAPLEQSVNVGGDEKLQTADGSMIILFATALLQKF